MKKVLLVIVLLLLAAIIGLRVYQNQVNVPADAQQTESPAPETDQKDESPIESPEPTATPEPTPYDPAAVLNLDDPNLDEETAQEIIQTEQEWASEGTGVGQLTPAEPNSGSQQQPEEPTIDIGEGQSGSFGF